MKKILLIILDGAADLPCNELGYKTPLEIAHTPSLNRIAQMAISGYNWPVKEGYVPQTHTGVLSMLGYDIMNLKTSRGPIEALGKFGEFTKGNLAFRANFSTSRDGKIIDRRVCRDITQAEADKLAEAINGTLRLDSGTNFILKSISTYRAVLVFQNNVFHLSDKITGTDPEYETEKRVSLSEHDSRKNYDIQQCLPTDNDAATYFTANLVNEFIVKASKVLQNHPINIRRQSKGKIPANFLILRDGGTCLPEIATVEERYKMKFCYLAELPIEHGIAKIAGMTAVTMRNGKDMKELYEKALLDILNLMKKYDGLIVHVKGADEPGHDGNLKAKVAAVERIDKILISGLLDNIDLKDTVLCITCDHATPWALGIHSADKVPVVLVTNKICPDGVQRFTERDCINGSLQLTSNRELFSIMVDYATK